MFNDDVAAICPECGASDIAMDATKITCQSCGHFEALGLEAEGAMSRWMRQRSPVNLAVISRLWALRPKDQARHSQASRRPMRFPFCNAGVLQASVIVAQSRFPIRPRNCAD